MRGRLALIVLVTVIASSCANSELGRSVPTCPPDPTSIDQVSATMLLQLQAVDTARYVPCLNDLNAGWTYEDLMAHRGTSRFWLDSDRLGTHFLTVTLSEACDTTGLPEVIATRADLTEYRDVELIGSGVTIVIIPETDRVADYARTIEAELEAGEINGRQVFIVFDRSDRSLTEKVAEAARRNRPVIVVSEEDEQAGTASLRMPGDTAPVRGLDIDDLLDVLDDRLPAPSFTGRWVRRFEGGCIEYEFNAHGAGVDRLAEEVERAIGLYPAAEVRQAMRDMGILS